MLVCLPLAQGSLWTLLAALAVIRAVLEDGTLQAKPGAMTSHQADMESDSIFRFECWPGF